MDTTASWRRVGAPSLVLCALLLAWPPLQGEGSALYLACLVLGTTIVLGLLRSHGQLSSDLAAEAKGTPPPFQAPAPATAAAGPPASGEPPEEPEEPPPRATPERWWRSCCCVGPSEAEAEPAMQRLTKDKGDLVVRNSTEAFVGNAAPAAMTRQVSAIEGPAEAQSPGLAWPTAQEQADVAAVVAGLTVEERRILERQPADITHLLFMTRFLRGHGSVPEARKALSKMLAYRVSHADVIARARARIPSDADAFDRDRLLALDAVPWRYVQCLPTGLRSSLPMSFIPLCTIPYEAWVQWKREDIIEFLVSAAEQMCVVLHNLSLEQRRMVKMVEIRDCAGMPVGNPVKMLRVFRDGMPVAALYPELAHRCLLFNASSGMARMVALYRAMEHRLIKRDKREDKVRMFALGDWDSVAEYLTLDCVLEWARVAGTHDDAGNQKLQQGHVAYRAIRLASGSSARWTCSADAAVDIQAIFFAAGGQVSKPVNIRGVRRVEETSPAPASGVLLLTAAAHSAAWIQRPVRLQLKVEAR